MWVRKRGNIFPRRNQNRNCLSFSLSSPLSLTLFLLPLSHIITIQASFFLHPLLLSPLSIHLFVLVWVKSEREGVRSRSIFFVILDEEEWKKEEEKKKWAERRRDITMRQVQSCSFLSSNKFLVKRTIGRFRKREEWESEYTLISLSPFNETTSNQTIKDLRICEMKGKERFL